MSNLSPSAKSSDSAEQLTFHFNPGDILYSYPAMPNPDEIYYDHLTYEAPGLARGIPSFSMSALVDYLALLETVVLHERVIVGSGIMSVLQKEDYESEACRQLVATYLPATRSRVPPLEVYSTLKQKGILVELRVKARDIDIAALINHYVNTSTIASQIRYYERKASKYDHDRERCERIALHLTLERMGVPLLLTEVGSQVSKPVRISDLEKELVSEITQIERDIEKGVVEELKRKLDAGALEEIKKLQELGHTTIFPTTPIAGQILSESRTPTDLLQAALSLRKEYSDFRRETSKLEKEIFSPDLTIDEKLKYVRSLDEMANTLWSRKDNASSIFQQVTDEVSAISDIAISAANPLAFVSTSNTALNIVNMPWRLVRSHLRRRKVRAMLNSRDVFMNSRPAMERVAEVFHCPERMIQPIRSRNTKRDTDSVIGALPRGLRGT